ncbi:hypothetical protein CI109_104651 [Kwoniella shandongensis]|uniref:Uncharacterized protein n=1 Tax=Kwoniella shandongensis TaxID=1734106 RepID=A0A5M6BVD1_9TREE|nr:uncharacterized protein CI109_004817 [Kwoniella shandongensis]KAA5526817.1 hypothetical protein CI109_004817 [Kwoniella shandongensis]
MSRYTALLRSLPALRSSLRPLSSPHHVTRRSFQNMLSPDPSSDQATNLAINKLTARGFVLSDDLVIPGGTIIHSGRAILWDVDPPLSAPKVGGKAGLEGMWEGWGEERFRVFDVLTPRPEILLFGTGLSAIPAPKRIREYISSLGIQLDVMDTRNAASTYNLLAEEGRTIAAALCPLDPIDPKTGKARG